MGAAPNVGIVLQAGVCTQKTMRGRYLCHRYLRPPISAASPSVEEQSSPVDYATLCRLAIIAIAHEALQEQGSS